MNRSQATVAAVVIVLMALVSWSPPAIAQAPTYSVSGKVLSDQGNPIEGATVYGSSWSPDGRHGGEDKTLTDAEGAYTLELAAGTARVTVQYGEWNAFDGREVSVDGDETGVDFTLKTPPPRTAIVEGRVLDGAGKPLEGVVVRLDQGCCKYYADAGYGEDGSTGATEGSAEATPKPTPTPATPPPSAPSEGNSTSMSYGEDDVRIMPVPCCYDHGQTRTTGPDGAFRFETYGGPVVLSAYARGYAQDSARLEARDGATVTQDLTLPKVPPADAILRGRVVDAATGKPLAGAQVNLANLEWGRYESATAGADGTYEAKVLPGWTQVTVYPGYGPIEPMPAEDAPLGVSPSSRLVEPQRGYYQHTVTLRLASGANAHDAKLEPKPEPTVVLQGYVVDPDAQKGVPGATVNVWNQDTGDWGSAVTDATGSYKILVRPGHYTANAWAEGHLQAATTFVIGQDENLKRVDLHAPAGKARWAPCDECHEEPTFRGDSAASAPSSGASDEANALATSESGADADKSVAATPAPMLADGANNGRSGAATYSGSGGGLPEYNPSEAPRPDEGVVAAGEPNAVPAPGLVLVAAAVGLAALVLARRK